MGFDCIEGWFLEGKTTCPRCRAQCLPSRRGVNGATNNGRNGRAAVETIMVYQALDEEE
jgi:hypothetical protein